MYCGLPATPQQTAASPTPGCWFNSRLATRPACTDPTIKLIGGNAVPFTIEAKLP